jgi:hypothetical protein
MPIVDEWGDVEVYLNGKNIDCYMKPHFAQYHLIPRKAGKSWLAE